MKNVKMLMCFVCVCILFFSMEVDLFAAEGGTRPISMGGAFIAVADDSHAASWNPAGMAWQEEFEMTYSAIINNRVILDLGRESLKK